MIKKIQGQLKRISTPAQRAVTPRFKHMNNLGLTLKPLKDSFNG